MHAKFGTNAKKNNFLQNIYCFLNSPVVSMQRFWPQTLLLCAPPGPKRPQDPAESVGGREHFIDQR